MARRATKPRCFLVYALAPEGVKASEANERINALVADEGLPLAIFHDHFIGRPGGVAVFFVGTAEEREALERQGHLAGWQVDLRPMVFSRSPAAFDEQVSFTLRAYRGEDWEALQREKRPTYGDPVREAQTAEEDWPEHE